MNLRPFVAKTSFFVVAVLTIAVAVVPAYHPVQATALEDQLAQIEKDLANIAKNKQDLQGNIDAAHGQINQYSGQIGKLNGQVQSLQLDISQLDLQVQEVNVNIQILNSQITDKTSEIQANEVHIATIESESDARIQSNYMDYRIHKSNGVDFFTVKNANTYFKDSQYNEIIQDDTNKVLQDLADSKVAMQKDQADLEEKQISVERSKAMLDEQHAQLDRKQADLQAQVDSYNQAIYNAQSTINGTQASISQLSQEEAQKQAQRDQLRQQLFNSYSAITGQYVVAGTAIGYQGATGYAFGEHLHFYTQLNGQLVDPCNYVPSTNGPVGSYVGPCSGNGSIRWPEQGSFWYTNGFWSAQQLPGQAPSYHYAIDLANTVHNAPIYAATDGYVCSSVDQYGANYIIICQNSNCNSGFKTGYWHMSSVLVQNRC